MSKKFMVRVMTWVLLVIGLTVVTYYARVIFVQSLKTQIVELEQKESRTKNSIKIINAQIDKYNELKYDDNLIAQMIPLEESTQILINDYIDTPLAITGAVKVNSDITVELPKNLKLPNDVNAKKISLTMEVDDIDVLYDFIDELYNNVRCVYFGDLNVKLPSENELLSDEQYTIVVHIEYYVFYYNK